uniref:Uncharacterized protein n=1 Tax=Parastrongyloides trichosuri TaxID=131310 RepID=A0A0N4ZRX3_PARTI
MFSSIKNAQKIRQCVEHGESLQNINLSREVLIDIPLKKFKEITEGIILPKWESKGHIQNIKLVTVNIEGTEKASILHK